MRKIILLISLFLVYPIPDQAQEKVVIKFLYSFGGEGIDPGFLNNPMGISIDPQGNIYIADTGNNRIQKLDAYGQVINFIGGFGWDSEQFQKPVDIWANNGLDVFVADYENRRIERYDKDLNWISSLYSDSRLPEELHFGFPCGIANSIHGELFLTDDENYRVLKFSTERIPILNFGGFDWGEGKLEKPCKILVTKDDKVYVTDLSAGCIVEYDYYGNFLMRWGESVLSQPSGICKTLTGHLVITDKGTDQIVVFDRTGRVICQWGSGGDKLGAFKNPADVACFADKLFVVDSGNHRVQVFSLTIYKNEK